MQKKLSETNEIDELNQGFIKRTSKKIFKKNSLNFCNFWNIKKVLKIEKFLKAVKDHFISQSTKHRASPPSITENYSSQISTSNWMKDDHS